LSIVRNCAYSWLRQNRMHDVSTPIEDDLEDSDSPGLEGAFLQQADHDLLREAIAALLVGVVLTAGLFQTLNATNRQEALAGEVLSSHIRSLMVDHLEDVASTDQHTVKPWFDGKLDFSPTVVDLSPEGFPLIGGRLDYLDNRAVTALVYQRQKHVINLFAWPTPTDADTGTSLVTQQGYHLIHWAQSGTTYWAVSDLETGELQTFVHLIQNRVAGVPS
jgi:anti-sigma factor RsiW